jgi:hypothetical protein
LGKAVVSFVPCSGIACAATGISSFGGSHADWLFDEMQTAFHEWNVLHCHSDVQVSRISTAAGV